MPVDLKEIEALVRLYPQYKDQIISSAITELVKSKTTTKDIERIQQMFGDNKPYISKSFDVSVSNPFYKNKKIALTRPVTKEDYQLFYPPYTVSFHF